MLVDFASDVTADVGPNKKLPLVPAAPPVSSQRRDVGPVTKREFAECLAKQVSERRQLETASRLQNEREVAQHILSDYWRPQPIYRYKRPKMKMAVKDYSLTLDPISGRTMPCPPHSSRVMKKRGPFDFDPWAKVGPNHNSLPLGTSHQKQHSGQRFPRIATDAVYRDLPGRKFWNVSDLGKSENGIPGGVTASMKTTTTNTFSKTTQLEKLQVTDWNRYY